MNINTEQLKLQHAPILQQWVGRTSGAMTPNDFPREKRQIQQWLELNMNDTERLDCLIFVYDTPVGITGLRHDNTSPESAELYMLLCEVGYNLIALERMGFSRQIEKGELMMVEAGRKAFYSRKYLF